MAPLLTPLLFFFSLPPYKRFQIVAGSGTTCPSTWLFESEGSSSHVHHLVFIVYFPIINPAESMHRSSCSYSLWAYDINRSDLDQNPFMYFI